MGGRLHALADHLAAHPAYGLAAGVHTADLGRAMRFERGLEAGIVWVNRNGRSWDFAIPAGGFKQSGIGKVLGRHAFEANLRTDSLLGTSPRAHAARGGARRYPPWPVRRMPFYGAAVPAMEAVQFDSF